jgi:hypothetical protein
MCPFEAIRLVITTGLELPTSDFLESCLDVLSIRSPA